MSRDVQTPGPSEQLTKRFGVKGAIALRLDEVIAPVAVIEPVPRRGAIGQTTAVVNAGFMSECSITAAFPLTTADVDTARLQIHVTKVHVSLHTVVGDVLFVRPAGGVSGVTGVTAKAWKEFQKGAGPPAQIAFKNTAAATTGLAIARFFIPATEETFTFDFTEDPFILGGRDIAANSLIIRPASIDETIRVTFEWSEGPVDI